MKVCVGCVYEYDWTEPLTAIPEGCKDCKMVDGKPSNYKQKPMTNADRIRAMSDEELAEFLYSCEFCNICEEGCDDCHYNGECERCLADWLKQPAESNI